MDIRGIGVIVTGASRGLGAALSRELAARGARVAMVARGRAELETVVASIRALGGEAYPIVADVGDKESVYPIAGMAAALVGPIDLLVNNASVLGTSPLALLLDTECEELSRALEVNLIGPFRLAKAVLGSMVVRGKGLVIDVTSDAAVAAYPTWGAYGVSKEALEHLGRIWAAELEGTNVRVLSVDPGEMNTPMHAAALPLADPATLADPADVARRMAGMIEAADSLPTGARVEAAGWKGAA